MKRIGIDVGGTFTDVVLLDDEAGSVWTTKVPTTPADRVIGTIDGFKRILDLSGFASSDISFLGHGTTMATNMIVEGKGARSALVTTKGFRDILELRRVSRHDRADLYDLLFDNPQPLVPRRWRLEVDERLRFDGTVERPLDLDDLRSVADTIARSDIESVAVVFLHAHVDPKHEIAAVEELRRLLPDRFICASHEINPEIMEYERASSTVINAMLGPVCGRYIARLEAALGKLGFVGEFLFMQSNGGLADPSVVAQRPIVILESGPAGGVSAAVRNCQAGEIPNAILGDMGGTTFDVSLIRGFRPEVRSRSLLHTYTVRSPSIDIDSVGAGGGSIAWIDAGGGVHIGPESAAADPGPACYGRGGDRPTVTDCNLILGYVDPKSFLGGSFPLDASAAFRVVEKQLAKPLGVDVVRAAQIVRSIANARMAQAIRIMTVERGYDPREFTYICYGGAGPLHALDMAQEIGIRRVVIPPLPGLFSAFGVTVADQQYDFQAPVDEDIARLDDEDLIGRFQRLEASAWANLGSMASRREAAETTRHADCRYVGQPDSILIDLPPEAEDTRGAIKCGFETAHKRLWNFVSPDKPVIVSNLRLQISATTGWRGSIKVNEAARKAPEIVGTRDVHFEDGLRSLPVFKRQSIPVGVPIEGPAVIEEDSSCLVLKPSSCAVVDNHLNLVVELS